MKELYIFYVYVCMYWAVTGKGMNELDDYPLFYFLSDLTFIDICTGN